jgi:RHS repeat-associated protein
LSQVAEPHRVFRFDGRKNAPDRTNGNISEYLSANGEIVAHYEYSPFGETIKASGTMAEAFTFRFSTKYEDAESGLYYYGFRYYNPATGRWLNRDPLGEGASKNIYGAASNNLIGNIDVLGLYQEAGHFYTAYYVAELAGYSAADAFAFAYYTQLPDEYAPFDAITQYSAVRPWPGREAARDEIDGYLNGYYINGYYRKVQELIHSLHGGGPAGVSNRRKCLEALLKDPSLQPWERGIINHAFGDSFAHTRLTFYDDGRNEFLEAYPFPAGHGVDSVTGKDPDIIFNHPQKHVEYTSRLYSALGGGSQNLALLKAFQDMAVVSPDKHDVANKFYSDFVRANSGYVGAGFGFYKPELGEIYARGGNYPLPTPQQLDALFKRIEKACCP